MAIDATVSGSAANSYVTLAEAQAYFAGRFPSTDWDDATEPHMERALLTGTKRLDRADFRGVPRYPLTGTATGTTQALKWPRQGVTNEEGWTYLDTVIPQPIKEAQMELAYAVLSGDLSLAASGLEQFDEAKVGPLEVKIRHQRKSGDLPEVVRRLIRPLTTGSAVTVPLWRS